jgi:hypothetical protein
MFFVICSFQRDSNHEVPEMIGSNNMQLNSISPEGEQPEEIRTI